MAKLELDKQTLQDLSRLLARRLKDDLDVDIEPFDALALLDYLAETLGPHYYNRGLHDAQAIVRDRADATVEALYALEKPLKR